MPDKAFQLVNMDEALAKVPSFAAPSAKTEEMPVAVKAEPKYKFLKVDLVNERIRFRDGTEYVFGSKKAVGGGYQQVTVLKTDNSELAEKLRWASTHGYPTIVEMVKNGE